MKEDNKYENMNVWKVNLLDIEKKNKNNGDNELHINYNKQIFSNWIKTNYNNLELNRIYIPGAGNNPGCDSYFDNNCNNK